MKLRYKYRIYPNVEQQQKLAQFFGCCRVVHNDALALYKKDKFFPGAAKLVITENLRESPRLWRGMNRT